MKTAAAMLKPVTPWGENSTLLYHLRYKELPNPYLIWQMPERERK